MNLFKKLFNRLPDAYSDTDYPIDLSGNGSTNVTHDSAYTLAAVWRAVRLISQTIACLPFHVQKVEGDRRERLRNKTDSLISTSPNEEMTAFDFWEAMAAWAVTWGNGYAIIERSINGQPHAMYLQGPDRLEPDRTKSGKLVYVPQGGGSPYDKADVFHLRGPGWNGLKGASVIQYARDSIGTGIAADKFGKSFFDNKATLGTILKHPAGLSTPAQKRLKKQMKKYQGSKKAFKTFVLEEGMDISQMGLPPGDAQFIETKQHTVTEVARWFGVPPHKIADLTKSSFSNIEHQSIEFVQDGILPWACRIEQEANIKLLGYKQRAKQRTKMHLQGLMRGDQASRANFYRTLFDMGVFSPNDILRLEDQNPIGPEGDKHLVQMNLTTLEKVGEEPEPPPEPPAPAEDETPEEIAEAAEKIERREKARIAESLQMSGPRAQKWREAFSAEHKHYIRNRLFEAVEQTAARYELNAEAARVVVAAVAEERAACISEGEEPEAAAVLARRVFVDCLVAMNLKIAS